MKAETKKRTSGCPVAFGLDTFGDRWSLLIIREIMLRGNTLMKGYLANRQETEKAFAGGWFHTGDLGYVDEDGYLYIADREKDMIISGAFNIYSKEVEQVIIGMETVAEAAVVGVADEIYGEAVAAFVVLETKGAPDAEQIIAHCKDRIASYKKPKYVFFVDDLPRNSLGKVLKGDLRQSAARLIGVPAANNRDGPFAMSSPMSAISLRLDSILRNTGSTLWSKPCAHPAGLTNYLKSLI